MVACIAFCSGVHGMQCPHLLSLPPQLEEGPGGDPIVILHTGHCLSTVSTTSPEKKPERK